MCPFLYEPTVFVCNVAIGHVRKTIAAVLRDAAQHTTVDGLGTLVETTPAVDVEQFQTLKRAAIAAA